MLSLFIIHMVLNSWSSSQVIQLQAFHLYGDILFNFIINNLAYFFKEPWRLAVLVLLFLLDREESWHYRVCQRKHSKSVTKLEKELRYPNTCALFFPVPMRFCLMEPSLKG